MLKSFTVPDLNAPATPETAVATVHHLFILDESGSMQGVTSEVIEGFNQLIKGLKEDLALHTDVAQYFHLCLFDTDGGIRHPRWMQAAKDALPLGPKDYRPNGGTPLLDAVGTTVEKLRRHTQNMEAHTAMVTVFTDGQENSSQHWTIEKVKALIAQCQQDGWTFTLFGSGIDSWAEAGAMGFHTSRDFQKTEEGISDMMRSERMVKPMFITSLKERVSEGRGRSYSSEEVDEIYRKAEGEAKRSAEEK